MSITKNVLLNSYSSMKRKMERFQWFLTWKTDFESQILALFDNSPLHQFAKLNNFLLVCWFLVINLSNLVSLPWNLDNPYYHIFHFHTGVLPSLLQAVRSQRHRSVGPRGMDSLAQGEHEVTYWLTTPSS